MVSRCSKKSTPPIKKPTKSVTIITIIVSLIVCVRLGQTTLANSTLTSRKKSSAFILSKDHNILHREAPQGIFQLRMIRKHIGIFSSIELEKIFNGQIQTIIRLSQKRIAPFSQVQIGDLVYLKLSGGEIKGQFLVKKVIFFEGLEEMDVDLIKKLTSQKIILKEKTKFLSIIFMDQIEQFITSPIKFKKTDQRAWVLL